MRILLLALVLALPFASCSSYSVHSSSTVTMGSNWEVQVVSDYDTISAQSATPDLATFRTSNYLIEVDGERILVDGVEVAAIPAGAKSVTYEQDEFRVQVKQLH